ncbi:MAG: hypothetical protein JWQ04_3289 [Pedosphaera sp.]|nr:hypothetical protein [Pedosphaera sp.]
MTTLCVDKMLRQRSLRELLQNMRLMGVEKKRHFRENDRNVRALIIGNYQPIFVRTFVKAAENFAPRKLPLAGELGIQDALMKCPALGVVRRGSFIKRMGMCEQQQLNASGCIGQDLEIKRANVRAVDAKLVPRPTGYWQGTRLRRQRWLQNCMRNNYQVLKLNFSSDARNHMPFKKKII